MADIKKKSFVSDHAQLMEQWDWEKNTNLDPQTITLGSGKIAWWLCPQNHSYPQQVCRKMRRVTNCPICSGHLTISGVNDFATIYPDIAKEWHPTKNGDLLPSTISKKNGKKVWWQCAKGHEWKASIHDRADGTGCPKCSAGRNTSFPEQTVFYYVKQLYPDAINRYRDLFDNGMELDIYIPSLHLGIEFDGVRWHNSSDSLLREQIKYSICKQNNVTLIRIKEKESFANHTTADEIYIIRPKQYRQDLPGVIQHILDSIDSSSNKWTRRNPHQVHSSILVNLERDVNEIRQYLLPTETSLAFLRPDVAEEWHPTKNGSLSPAMFGVNSNSTAWWQCRSCGHEWQTIIISRAGKHNSGCPACANVQKGKTFTKKCVAERGSLAENNPSLAAEWHPIKNGKLTPHDITEKRFAKVWWLCQKCGYSWEASPLSRSSKGVGCPACSGRVPRIGENDFQTLFPQLAKEWAFDRNGELRPEQFLPKSGKKVWWRCQRCDSVWEAEIRSRTNGHNCPYCARKKEKTKSRD